MKGMSCEERDLWALYSSIVDEQHRYLDRLQGRVSFYTGLLITLIGGSVVAFLKAPWILNFVLMSVGGFIVSLAAFLATRGIFRTYRLFTECISTRAKLEHSLGIDAPRGAGAESRPGDWIKFEPYVASRHLKNRETPKGKPYQSSAEFEKAMQKKWWNFIGITHATFIVALIIGVILTGLGIALLVLNKSGILEALRAASGM